MRKQKINVKERFTDGEIDLSMSELSDVPVKDIASIRKVSSLDLSNNNLYVLPKNFPILTHITKLDLSKNQLKELPADFGNLVKLTYLDLYKNQLEHLPISFGNLKALKWLDLKDNPLVPAVANVAGPCLDAKQCQECAKRIVQFFIELRIQIDSEVLQRKEKQKLLESKQQQKIKNKDEARNKKQKQATNKSEKKLVEKVEEETATLVEKSKTSASRKTSLEFSIFMKIQIFFSLLFLVFILTSIIDSKYTKFIQESTICLYNKTVVEWLPADYKMYAIQAGQFIGKIQEKTANIVMKTIEKCVFHLQSISVYIERTGNFFFNIFEKKH